MTRIFKIQFHYIYSYRRILPFAICILLISLAHKKASAQTFKNVIITGTVLQSGSQLPIANAEVFINGSSIKETTDSIGNFSIKFENLPSTLVVYHKAFELKTIPTQTLKDSLKIELSPQKITPYKLEVKNNKKRKRDLSFFYSHFITEHNKEIKIVNDSVLFFIQNNKEFIAFSKQPLIIENKELGYTVKSIIKRFHIHKEVHLNGPQTLLKDNAGMIVLALDTYTYYDEMKSESDKQSKYFEQNRRKEYFGSQLHFLKSIYYGSAKKAGFEILSYPKNSIYTGIKKVSNSLSPSSSTLAKSFMIQGDSIVVNYKQSNNIVARYMGDNFDKSNTEKMVIHATGKIFQIFPNGTTANTGFIVETPSSPFFNSTLSLPLNYLPYR